LGGGGGSSSPATPNDGPKSITLSAEEVVRLYSQVRELEAIRAQHAAELQAREDARLAAMAEAGKAKEAIERLRADAEAKLAARTNAFLNAERSRAVSDLIAGRPFASDAAATQLRLLLEAQVEAVLDDSGSVALRDRVSGRPAIDVLREQLDSPAFAHFFRASSQSGIGASGSLHNPAPNTPPQSYQDQLIAAFKQQLSSPSGALGLGIPRPGL
jgi:hypothetical protein